MYVAAETEVGGTVEPAAQHVARVGPAGGAVGHRDVAEHAGGVVTAVGGGPRQDLEARWVRLEDGVRFGDTGETFDGRAVEADALGEGALEFGGGDRH